jgi:hypothetical protein
MSNLLKLYVFADMARIPSLMNQCLDTVKWISDALVHIPSYEIPRVWENTITGGPIRRFLIDSLVWKSKSEALSGILPTLPDDARLELTIAMKQVIESFETTKTTAQVVRPLWKMSNCHSPPALSNGLPQWLSSILQRRSVSGFINLIAFSETSSSIYFPDSFRSSI